MVPAIQNLPANFVEATNKDLRFETLPETYDKLLTQAEEGVKACNGKVDKCGKGGVTLVLPPKDTSPHHEKVMTNADNAIEVVDNVAKDKYLGSEASKNQSALLEKIKTQATSIEPKGDCTDQVTAYCKIVVESRQLLIQEQKRQDDLEAVRKGTGMEGFDTLLSFLPFLHLTPYIMIASLGCYSFAWYHTSGVCFWVRGGSCGTSCCLFLHFISCIFFTFFTSLNFILAVAIHFFLDMIPLSAYEGNPSVEDVIEHLNEKFPSFISTVTSELQNAWSEYFLASVLMEASAILILFYAACVSWKRPYLALLQDDDEESNAANNNSGKKGGRSARGNDDDAPFERILG
eukprot:CAMPEP_0179318830 /NCGR_PEP_ID=MMETSP0797-20121207/57130_1 /TAXON_ID=47934 /ORGANISM="Dinophysis acuminata, Strain DAEP01" /LENGTH=346 /DNA_ID=CAMNT_0021030099 /DNA_START=113 /DNA_END=1153 /DNA_ORIENTATION=-